MKKAAVPSILAVIMLAVAVLADAQQSGKIPRIGFLTGQTAPSSTSSGPNMEAFRQGLRDLGYTEGKNIIIEYRGAGGKHERMPELVAELIGLGVNVIVTVGMPAVIAAKKATSTIPIVTANADNLVEAGLSPVSPGRVETARDQQESMRTLAQSASSCCKRVF
jgi:putative tryptophan/tyrosine transport system substrate-binding protein